MGLVFFRTADLDEIERFYTERVGCRRWLDQGGCRIFEHVGYRIGFCENDVPETDGCLTFLYPDRAGVDAIYERLQDLADDPPRFNPAYDIYQFFATDPEGRTLEFQTFEHEA